MREGREASAAANLLKIVDKAVLADCLVPRAEYLRKRNGIWRIETKTLFEGYVFILSSQPELLGKHLRALSTAAYLVAERERAYAPLADGEREWFSQVLGGDGTLGFSRGIIECGVPVVQEGPLKGLERRIRKIDRHKRVAYVSVNVNGAETTVQAGLEITQKS